MTREKLFSPFKEGGHPLQSLAGGFIKDTPYSLLDGLNISAEELQKLSEEDIKYLQFLAAEATGERGTEQRGKRGYIFLVELVRGLGAYPLRGSRFIKYYIDNLSENIKRGIRQKLRRGELPSLAPVGYLNGLRHHTIVKGPYRWKAVRALFEAYATDEHTLVPHKVRIVG